MKKNLILEGLKSVQIDNSLKNKPLQKNELIEKLKEFMPKPDGKGKVLDNIREKLNTNLADPKKEVKFEAEWKPARTHVKELSKRILIEAELENNKPNAFRLNLFPIVIDVTHAKFQATRGAKTAIVEILYPNANGKITIKVQVDGAEDKLIELSLEDPEYVNNLGVYIIKLVDESVKESQEQNQDEFNDYLGSGGQLLPTSDKNLGSGSFSPNWEAMRESDTRKMVDLMTLVEQGKDEEKEPEVTDEDVPDFGKAGGEGDLGDGASDEFSKDDFSVDAGAPTSAGDFTSDFGGGLGGGGGGLGDLGGGDEKKDVNSDGGEVGKEDVEYTTFRDKTNWLNSSMDTMQKLVSAAVADKMQEGTGVVLTSDEVLHGTVGMKGDNNFDIIDKFLKVYPELDEIDLKEEDLEQIEEKLSLDDGQFDPWLQQKLPEFTNEQDVTETLNNEMFDDFKPMGGENPDETPEGNLEEIPGEVPKQPVDITEISNKIMPDEEEKSPEEKEAELEIGGMELPEFPNIK